MLTNTGAAHTAQDLADIPFDTDRPPSDLRRTIGPRQVDAGVDRLRILVSHFPEGIFDDDRGIAAHAQFQKEDAQTLMAFEEILVAPGGFMPAFVFHEGHVRPQVHGHGRAADRAMRDQLAGD